MKKLGREVTIGSQEAVGAVPVHQWREGPFPGSLGPILLLPSRKPLTAGSPKTGGGVVWPLPAYLQGSSPREAADSVTELLQLLKSSFPN